MPSPTPAHPPAPLWLRAVAVLCVALLPALFYDQLAGDAGVHLVFAEAAAAGRWFQFNAGEAVAGVTSPGYLLVLTALAAALPAAALPVAAKLLSWLGWCAMGVGTWLLAKRVLGGQRRVWVATLVAALAPGSIHNGSLGMEASLFGAGTLFWLWWAARSGWLDGTAPGGRAGQQHALLLGFGAGGLVWLRPEGLLVLLVALAARWWSWPPRTSRALRRSGTLLAVAGAGVSVALLLLWHHGCTGRLLPASGWARVLQARRESHNLGPLLLEVRVLARMSLYGPLTALAAVAAWALRRRRAGPGTADGTADLGQGQIERQGDAGQAGPSRALQVVTVALPAVALAGYSFVLGGAQFARYALFLMPLWVIAAAQGAERLRADRLGRWVLVAGALWMGTLWPLETMARLSQPTLPLLEAYVRAPAQRRRRSDELLAYLGQPGGRPVVVALQEVELRYFLDERFVVRSLDGRTDPALLRHTAADGDVDHIGYLLEQGVQFLLETPCYGRGAQRWCLGRLGELELGEALERHGLRFRRLPDSKRRLYSVEPIL